MIFLEETMISHDFCNLLFECPFLYNIFFLPFSHTICISMCLQIALCLCFFMLYIGSKVDFQSSSSSAMGQIS